MGFAERGVLLRWSLDGHCRTNLFRLVLGQLLDRGWRANLAYQTSLVIHLIRVRFRGRTPGLAEQRDRTITMRAGWGMTDGDGTGGSTKWNWGRGGRDFWTVTVLPCQLSIRVRPLLKRWRLSIYPFSLSPHRCWKRHWPRGPAMLMKRNNTKGHYCHEGRGQRHPIPRMERILYVESRIIAIH